MCSHLLRSIHIYYGVTLTYNANNEPLISFKVKKSIYFTCITQKAHTTSSKRILEGKDVGVLWSYVVEEGIRLKYVSRFNAFTYSPYNV